VIHGKHKSETMTIETENEYRELERIRQDNLGANSRPFGIHPKGSTMKHLLFILFLTNCMNIADDPRLHYEYECPPEKNDQVAAWVLKCIEVANPKADEEPEDWIRQCEKTAKSTLCDQQPFLTYTECMRCPWSTVPCTDVQEAWLKEFCP
jgi:hypothetical protein